MKFCELAKFNFNFKEFFVIVNIFKNRYMLQEGNTGMVVTVNFKFY